MAAADYLNTVQKIYIAFYQRPADPEGLAYWAGRLDAVKGNLAGIINAFATSDEAQSLYGPINANTIGTVIDSIYLALFGRVADAGGKAFYVNGFTAGTFTAGTLTLNILDGARNEDATAITNKLAVATDFTNNLNTAAEIQAYSGDHAAGVVRGMLATVTDTTNPNAFYGVDSAIAQIIGGSAEPHVFTLQESVVAGVEGTPPTMAVYWGYNPNGEHGHHGGSESGPSDGGVPVAELVKFLTTITGLDLKELGLVDDDGVGPFDNVTNLTISNALTSSATDTNGNNNEANPHLTITYADGTSKNAEVELGAGYMSFLNDLLFDSNGNSRLYEVAVPGTGTSGSSDALQPIKLTKEINNGGTVEGGYTTDGDDVIVAGRLELLHRAYIDGGAGYNILEVDAKGEFAQPLELLNIQEVRVQNLPNFYTMDDGTQYDSDPAHGYLDNSSYPYLSGSGSRDSFLDLSRATSIQKLTVTEGNANGAGIPGAELGELTIVGVRNGATLRLEGGFTQDVTVHYGQGQTGPLTVELLLGQVAADLNFVHNNDSLHLVSLGGSANSFGSEDLGGRLTNLKISGDAALYINGDLDNSFQDATPITIDASENTKGVDLTLSDSEKVTFVGSQGNDTFRVYTYEVDQVIDTNGSLDNDTSVTIVGGAGDNRYEAQADTVTITNANGSNNYEVNAYTASIVAGNGNNHLELETLNTSVTLGNGNNKIEVGVGSEDPDDTTNPNYSNDVDKAATIVVGNGANVMDICLGDELFGTKVSVTAGNGGNTIKAEAASVSISTGTGSDVIDALGANISITSTGGHDTITVVGLSDDYTVGSNDGYADGAVLKIKTGTGVNDSATINLGSSDYYDLDHDYFPYQDGEDTITAMEGSSISGANITLVVNTFADLRAADLTNADIGRVVLDDDNYNSDEAVKANDVSSGMSGSSDSSSALNSNAMLTLTDKQFLAIGADAFSVDGAVFNTHAFVKIIVTQSTSLTALGVDALARNIDLFLEVQDGVTLTMTAQQLHTKVAPGGVTLVEDGNTDVGNGKVVITGGGQDFDPFNNSDTIKTNIDGTVYYGGSLSDDFLVNSKWFNVTVKSLVNGWDRPADVPAEVVITLDSTGTAALDQGAFSSWHTNLEVVGDQDINFTGAIQLGMNLGKPANPFTVDFSGLEGVANNLTLDNFEFLAQGGGVYGNGNNGYASEVHISIAADDGDVSGGGDAVGFDEADAQSLVSSGVARYVVTTIDGPTAEGSIGKTATIKLCDTAQDIEVFALRGNYNDTLNIVDAAWGLAFELQGGGTAKAEGPTGTSNVGSLVANYEWAGADAVVNIVHANAGDVRPLHVEGINISNADALAINVQGSATIDTLTTQAAESLSVDATGNVAIVNTLTLGTLDEIDASGVVGTFATTVAGAASGDDDFSFTGSTGGSSLTLIGFSADNGKSDGTTTTIDGGVGGVTLTIGDGAGAGSDVVDLSAAALAHVSSVVLTQGSSLTLSIAQAGVIGAGNFSTPGTQTASLSLTNLDSTLFVRPAFASDITVSVVSVAALPEVTLNAGTNLTGIASLAVPAGTTLNLTAAQFQQLTGSGTITGLTTNGFVVNITGLTAADVAGGFSLAGIPAGAEVNLHLAESVDLSAATLTGVDSITFGDDVTLTLGDVQQANGVDIVGGANSALKFTDTAAGAFESIDASGFNVSQLHMLNVLVDDRNIDLLFTGLAESITKIIYNDLGWVEGVTQTVSITAGTTVPGFVVFNKPEDSVEIQNFVLNLQGGTEISGNLRLSSSTKAGDLIQTHLQSVVINSSGTDANLLTGSKANVIAGDITSQGTGSQPSTPAYTSVDNNLLTVTINADQALTVTGAVVFESVVGDDAVTANDNYAATATLNVTGTAAVKLGDLNTGDDEVDALVVNHTGTGALTVGLNAANIDAADAITINGSTGATDTVVITGNVNLSNDTLVSVDALVLNSGAVVTLTQAQFDGIGAAHFTASTPAAPAETINIVGLGNAPFNATGLNAGLVIGTVTTQAGVVTLDPTTNLTGVTQIVVPEGSTLNLTATQFQQLAGNGSIVGLDVNGDSTIGAYTVNITGLTQANIANDLNGDGDSADAGELLDLSGIVGATKTLSLAENVNLAADTNLGTLAELEVLLAANQTLGLATSAQANGLNVTGAANSTLVYQFGSLLAFPAQIDASGYNVTTLKALAASFTIGGASNVEYSIDDLPSSVELRLYATPQELGYLDPTFRVVVVEAGITTPSGLLFNDWDSTDEVRTLNLTLNGGVNLNGDLSFPTHTPKTGGTQQYFDTVTINSVGTAANKITGNLNTTVVLPPNDTSENNLLKVVVNATQALNVTGDIVFNSVNVPLDNAVASLTITGTANVTVEQINADDADIDTVNIANNGTGTFTATGASPAFLGANIETLVLSGTGHIVFGNNPAVTTETGVNAATLSVINASALSGNLNLGEITNIDNANFSFTSGTGVTKLTLTSDALNEDAAADTGWNFNFTGAAAGSEFHLGSADAGTTLNFNDGAAGAAGSLNINLGANTTLYIDETTDLTDVDLSILGTAAHPIVLADGATLTLTAAQANGLYIVAGPDTGAAGITAKVNIVGLGDTPVDFSHIATSIAGDVTLEDNDVTLAVTTNLGSFRVMLDDLTGDSASLAGQTIRFTTVAQAERAIEVNNTGTVGDSSANVVWLFENALSAPINTSKYDAELGRLLFKAALVNNNGGLVESLFTTLPSTILRVDFATVTELEVLLTSTAVNRVMELASFVNVGNLTFSDVGLSPIEHIHSLKLELGGQVTAGNVAVADVIGAPGYDAASVSFDTLTINSHLALTGRTAASAALPGGNPNPNVLAAEAFVNNNDGTTTLGETAQPTNLNTVGNLSVGADNGVDLLKVGLNTFGVSVAGNGSAGDGAKLNVGTITFETDATGQTALLEVDGMNDVNITSVNTADTGISALTVDLTDNTAGTSDADGVGFSGVLTAPGASPAFNLNSTETLTFTNANASTGTVTLGNGSNAGVSGDTLSLIDARDFDGKLNLGTLALVDGTNDGAAAAFTFRAGDGLTTATLGEVASTQKLVAGSEWVFNYTGNTDAGVVTGSYLTITGDVEFEAASTLTLENVPVRITGNVNLSAVNLNVLGTLGSFWIEAGQSLTLSVAQAQALTVDVKGPGTLKIVGNGSNQPLGTNGHLKSVGVDISGVTLVAAPAAGADLDDTVALTLWDAISGTFAAQVAAGFVVTGSPSKDYVTLNGVQNSVVTAAGANDTVFHASTLGSHTYNVTSGTDTILGIEGDLTTGAGTAHDVLVVSAGATAIVPVEWAIAGLAGRNGFIATADTVNNGTVNLNGGTTDDTTVDLTAVTGGTNGFNILGGSDNATGLDTLIGSQKADVINGGNTDQAAAGAKDTLTGNGGADRFEFNVGVLNAATMAVATTTQGVDQEIITITAETDENTEQITVQYTLNTNTAVDVTVNLAAVNMGDAQAVATAIAEAIDPAAGITASAAGGVVTLTGDGGASLTINSLTHSGGFNPLSAVAGNGTDVAQVTTLTLSGTPVNGDIYSVTASQVAGGGFTASATAAGSTTATIATALAGTFVLAGITDVAAGSVVTFTDATPDNGGFSLVTDTTAAFSGSGASDIGATSQATADVITDFLSGTDVIDLNMVAGSGTNYVEAAAVANFGLARTAANVAFNGTTVQYYLTSLTDATPADLTDDTGLLFFDANLDGDVDGVIVLTGITSTKFAASDIVA